MLKSLLLIASLLGSMQTPQKPAVPEQMKKLDMFIGTWKGLVKVFMGSQEVSGPVVVKYEPILDGLYMQLTLEHTMPGFGVVKGLTVFGWDEATKKYKWWTFANEGGPVDPRIELAVLEGKKIVSEGKMGLMPYRQLITCKSEKELHFVMEMKQGDKWVKGAEGTMTKQ